MSGPSRDKSLSDDDGVISWAPRPLHPGLSGNTTGGNFETCFAGRELGRLAGQTRSQDNGRGLPKRTSQEQGAQRAKVKHFWAVSALSVLVCGPLTVASRPAFLARVSHAKRLLLAVSRLVPENPSLWSSTLLFLSCLSFSSRHSSRSQPHIANPWQATLFFILFRRNRCFSQPCHSLVTSHSLRIAKETRTVLRQEETTTAHTGAQHSVNPTKQDAIATKDDHSLSSRANQYQLHSTQAPSCRRDNAL